MHLGGSNQVFADGHVKWWSRAMMLANAGPLNAACNLTTVQADREKRANCSRAWNPFME